MRKGALTAGLALSTLALGLASPAISASNAQETVQSAQCPNFEDLFLQIALNHYLTTKMDEIEFGQEVAQRIDSLDSLLTAGRLDSIPSGLATDPGYLYQITSGDQDFILEIRYNVNVEGGKAEFSPEYRRIDLK
ncbi:hypothetical protein HN747_02550 [archaeon]|jgi:hypothetical protein|nr:hypothetical protein [archaeon]